MNFKQHTPLCEEMKTKNCCRLCIDLMAPLTALLMQDYGALVDFVNNELESI